MNRINRLSERRREIYRELEYEWLFTDTRQRLVRELKDVEGQTEALYRELRIERAGRVKPAPVRNGIGPERRSGS